MRSFNSVQRRSEGKKGGETISHRLAVGTVVNFIGVHWDRIFDSLPTVRAPLPVRFPDRFIAEKKIEWKKYLYDIGCTLFGKPVLIVEIGDTGDDSRHQPGNHAQLIKDGIAKDYISQYYPECRFERISKDDVYYREELKKRLFKK